MGDYGTDSGLTSAEVGEGALKSYLIFTHIVSILCCRGTPLAVAPSNNGRSRAVVYGAYLFGMMPEVRDKLGKEPTVTEQRRVNVNFSDSAYKTLEELARRKGKTMSEVLREAIALEKWFEDVQNRGDKVLVERQDGKTREIIRS